MTTFSFILDLLFPRQNDQYTSIESYLTLEEIIELRPVIKKLNSQQQLVFSSMVLGCDYENTTIQDLLHRAKLGGETAICYNLAKLLEAKFFDYNSLYYLTTKKLNCSTDIITFVPPDPKRYIERGYHLPELLAKHLGKITNLPVTPLLVKPKNTIAQSILDKNQRLKNLKDSFIYCDSLDFNPGKVENIFLIDDVITTGSTMYECGLILKQKIPFSKIHGVAVAGGVLN